MKLCVSAFSLMQQLHLGANAARVNIYPALRSRTICISDWVSEWMNTGAGEGGINNPWLSPHLTPPLRREPTSGGGSNSGIIYFSANVSTVFSSHCDLRATHTAKQLLQQPGPGTKKCFYLGVVQYWHAAAPNTSLNPRSHINFRHGYATEKLPNRHRDVMWCCLSPQLCDSYSMTVSVVAR